MNIPVFSDCSQFTSSVASISGGKKVVEVESASYTSLDGFSVDTETSDDIEGSETCDSFKEIIKALQSYETGNMNEIVETQKHPQNNLENVSVFPIVENKDKCKSATFFN